MIKHPKKWFTHYKRTIFFSFNYSFLFFMFFGKMYLVGSLLLYFIAIQNNIIEANPETANTYFKLLNYSLCLEIIVIIYPLIHNVITFIRRRFL